MKAQGGEGRSGERRWGERSVCELRTGGVYENKHEWEYFREGKTKKKARDREGRTASAEKICRRLFRTGLEWVKRRRSERQSNKDFHSRDAALPRASVSLSCYGAQHWEILTQGTNILVRGGWSRLSGDAGPIRVGRWSQNHVPCFDSHLGPVLSVRSWAIAFLGSPGADFAARAHPEQTLSRSDNSVLGTPAQRKYKVNSVR